MKTRGAQADAEANVEEDAHGDGEALSEDLAEMLRLKRLAHGFSRNAAALRAGVSAFTVRERERGHGLDTMVEIIRFLECIGVRVTFRSEPGMVREIPRTRIRKSE